MEDEAACATEIQPLVIQRRTPAEACDAAEAWVAAKAEDKGAAEEWAAA